MVLQSWKTWIFRHRFLMFLDNIFPPIPSEIIMPSAGVPPPRGFELNWRYHCWKRRFTDRGDDPYWIGCKIP